MKPCRDCGAPTAPSARSCPGCGILNPVMQWVALPNGEHLTAREPVGGAGAAAAMVAPAAPFSRLAAATPRKAGNPFGEDSLASWAIWAFVFAILSVTVVGGAIGGGIAAIIALPIGAMLPTRADGRKLPVWLSAVLFGWAIILLLGPLVLLVASR